MKTITGTIAAHLPSYYTTDDLFEATQDEAVNRVIYSHSSPDGWMKIGTAKITITMDDNKTIVANQIEILKEAKTRLQAETQAKLTAIDEQIGKLLCLEHKPATEDE